MDQCEQLEVDDDQPIDCDLVAGWSSTRRKVESVAEKVSWSSSVGLVGVDCVVGDSSGDLNLPLGQSVIAAASTSKWSSDKKITESYVDDLADDGEGGSLIVVHNRSARRLETHTESIVTRKVRSRVIEIEDEDDDDDDVGSGQDEGGFFEEEQIISAALSSSSIDDQGKKSDSSPISTDEKLDSEQSESESGQQQQQQQQSPILSLIKLCESGSTATLSLTKSCWSSTVTESIESIDESFIGQTNEDDATDSGLKLRAQEKDNDGNVEDDDGQDDEDEGDNKLTQQVWSRIEKIRDEYEKSSSLLLSSSSSQSHNHQIWSSVHSESIESIESTEFISATLSSSSAVIDEGKIINDNYDYDQEVDDVDDDDGDDDVDDDNSNLNSREISRCNSNEDNDDNVDDESFESDKEVAISIRRPSLSLVKAEAYVFRSRKSLEELETEIVIRKKRKPKVNKEMDETATIFIANCDSKLINETSPVSSPSSSSSSLPLSSLSMKPIVENRSRDNLIDSLTKHGSLDTETDSNEDDEEVISEQYDGSTNYLDDDIDQLSQLAGDRFDWNRDPITTVFKSDQEINDLF